MNLLLRNGLLFLLFLALSASGVGYSVWHLQARAGNIARAWTHIKPILEQRYAALSEIEIPESDDPTLDAFRLFTLVERWQTTETMSDRIDAASGIEAFIRPFLTRPESPTAIPEFKPQMELGPVSLTRVSRTQFEIQLEEEATATEEPGPEIPDESLANQAAWNRFAADEQATRPDLAEVVEDYNDELSAFNTTIARFPAKILSRLLIDDYPKRFPMPEVAEEERITDYARQYRRQLDPVNQ